MPDTGITRRYNFTLTRAIIAPDGYEKSVILVNNQFPGPMVEANWGDWIEVEVFNNIEEEEQGTAIHWHGNAASYLEKASLIGLERTSRELHGGILIIKVNTSMALSVQPNPLLKVKAIVIHGPEHQDYDVDLGTILLHDWRHKSFQEVDDQVLNVRITDLLNLPKLFNLLPVGDGNLINGKSFTIGVCIFGIGPGCNQDYSSTPKWILEPGKRYKLRLLNVGGDGTQKFSVDNHNLSVISTDFTQIEPYETEIVTIGVGQRQDVILTANAPTTIGAFWVRANVAWCSLTWRGSALAAMFYSGADTTKMPTTDPHPDPFELSTTVLCGNDPIEMSKPWFPMDAEEPTTTLTFNNFYTINATGYLKFSMAFPGSYSGNYTDPLLYKGVIENEQFTTGLEYDPNRALFNPDQVYDVGTNKTVRVVVNNPTFAQNAHAMHLHGHDFYVLSNGAGVWDGTLNTRNPMRRDTQIVVPDGHLVFQYTVDNPGMWALHCHIPWHLADGLVVNFLEHREEASKFLGMKEDIESVCNDWKPWVAAHPINDNN
ncbi:uncharacterized protein PV09_02999 [Verruconis gallopava]|uniref:Multicopper oxidase n=1 Tax=Verruconis gallopava TaxID=253628 RepID=A0A0D1XUY2_9PEZI|nr:uncharacterized protein PV09_02999 [Verruconis gallopava]KIW06571.1 hypothetical protein PV09_02999 [Verruconis gallopava]